MSYIDTLRLLYYDLSDKLSTDEERKLRNLLRNKQIGARELDKLNSPAEIFIKLDDSGYIGNYEAKLTLLKDLLKAIDRRPLVSDVERVEELQVWRLERGSDESKVKNTDMQSSVGGDVTASSEKSSAAVHREMARTMEDPEGEPTSLQHHKDNHGLRRAQYIRATTAQANLQLQGQGQADFVTAVIAGLEIFLREKIELEQQLNERKEKEKKEDKNKEKMREEITKVIKNMEEGIASGADPAILLTESMKRCKAVLEMILVNSLLFILRYLSVEDMEYFWEKYKSGEVEKTLAGILISSEIQAMADEAGFSVGCILKIDETEFNKVKQVMTDMQSSVGGNVTASSEISSAAVHKEMARTMEDPEGEPTGLQHHIDIQSLHHAQYIPETNVHAKPHPKVKEQADGNTGSQPSERQNGSVESPRPAESKYPDVVLRCERDLKSLYIKSSEILAFPWWDGTNRLKLENVYTELELQTKKGEKRDFSRRDIFSSRTDEESRTKPKRVLIEGDPGYGKSTFCKQLIYDWAKGDTEYLNNFKLMFHFELRDLLHSDAQNIQDAIFNELLKAVRDENERRELWNFVHSNQERVCFVFDGLDEVPTKDLPPYFNDMIAVNCLLLACPVIVTSRKIRDKNSKQMYDTQLSIKGFDYEKARFFIEKHMNEMKTQGELKEEVISSGFLQELEKSNHRYVLIDFMQSPLNTLMLCDIWIRSEKLPNTRTKLYEEIINYVVKRYDPESDFEEEIKQALFSIGEMSYRGLTTRERKVYFSEEDISHNRYIRELGLLTKVSGFPSKYGFFHLTFQEYFASLYVANLLKKDRRKFIDAISSLSQGRSLNDNSTLFEFIGGKLQNDVIEIFKVMEKKGILTTTHSSFDPRQILYESCCTTTAVFEQCATFMSDFLTVDFNTMVSHSDSNRLNVNTAILQCSRLRSEWITFKLSAVDADTVAMYRKCSEALQTNRKKFDSISVEITFDLNDCEGIGRDYVEDFSFMNNTYSRSAQNLKPLNIRDLSVDISKRVKPTTAFNDHLTAILKGLSQVPADWLHIKGLPPGNLELTTGLIGSLSGNKVIGHIYMTFCDDCTEYFPKTLLDIETIFHKFSIEFKMNKLEFNFVDLYTFLSTSLSVDCKNLSKVRIYFNLDTKIITDVTDALHRLSSVDIEQLYLEIEDSSDVNKENIYPRVSSIIEATSKISAKEFEIKGLPPGNLDFMREVLNYLNRNKLIRSIFMLFGDRRLHGSWEKRQRWFKFYYDDLERDPLHIGTRFGKFNIDYNSKTMKFKLVDLHRLLSTFVGVENESLSLDVVINSDLRKKTESVMTDILPRLQSVHLVNLRLNTSRSLQRRLGPWNYSLRDLWLNKESMYAHVRTIAEKLSRVSAKRLNIESLPLGNVEFMIHVLGCLRNNHRLQFVSIEFHENFCDKFQIHTMNIHVTFGKFKVCLNMNTMDFKLSDLHQLFQTSVSGNQRKLPDVSLNWNVADEMKINIVEVLSKLESVEIGELSLWINSYSVSDSKKKEILSIAASIGKVLSRVSANKIVIDVWPSGNLNIKRNILAHLRASKLRKSDDVRCILL